MFRFYFAIQIFLACCVRWLIKLSNSKKENNRHILRTSWQHHFTHLTAVFFLDKEFDKNRLWLFSALPNNCSKIFQTFKSKLSVFEKGILLKRFSHKFLLWTNYINGKYTFFHVRQKTSLMDDNSRKNLNYVTSVGKRRNGMLWDCMGYWLV